MDIICFCHLRWNFVYQRPQHIMTRLARNYRVILWEEPIHDATEDTYTIGKDESGVWIVTPHLTPESDPVNAQRILLQKLMENLDVHDYITWYYSPMGLAFSNRLSPVLTVYDCMDELSAFHFAPPALKEFETVLLNKADIVFTGGHHLYEAKKHLHPNIHPLPSSIDKDHFARARQLLPQPDDQLPIPYPRIGYYGVVDERFNTGLLKEVAAIRPDWHFIIIGPVAKIDPASLPEAGNIHYLGMKTYTILPVYLSGWDVAMMPFALNESTKYISPTKTPEYLAGGKPVVSTSIRDVVIPYGTAGLVEIADTPHQFAASVEWLLSGINKEEWLKKTDEFLADQSWDHTVAHMEELITEALKKDTTFSVTLENPHNYV